MAHIAPFKGIVYNPQRITDLGQVVTPPYDVIGPQEQEAYYERHPQNVIRLDLNQTTDQDTEADNRYTRAAAFWRTWREEGILSQDPAEAFYLTATDFSLDERLITRYGLIALVRLEPFEKGIVLPHEKTFSKVKTDRLNLIEHCQANFSQIFSLYSDKEQLLERLIRATEKQAAEMDFSDNDGMRHRLWRILDTQTQQLITDTMSDKTIFIADGHHRYETALTYRDLAASRIPGFSENHPANFVMMYLASMEDAGLIIRPAHRLLKAVDPALLQAFIHKAEAYFNIKPFALNGEAQDNHLALTSELEQRSHERAIGVVIKGKSEGHVLTLKPGVMADRFGQELEPALRALDVTVLTRLIFMDILGFDQARLDDETRIAYTSDACKAVEAAKIGEADAAFILNPTKIEQVKATAEQRLIMPRKSTYFYPKAITGMVMNSLT